MNRHRFEPARLLLGLLLAGAALTYVMDALGQWQVPVWLLLPMVPVALVMAAFTAWTTFLVRRLLLRRRKEAPSVRAGDGMPTDDRREGWKDCSGEEGSRPSGDL